MFFWRFHRVTFQRRLSCRKHVTDTRRVRLNPSTKTLMEFNCWGNSTATKRYIVCAGQKKIKSTLSLRMPRARQRSQFQNYTRRCAVEQAGHRVETNPPKLQQNLILADLLPYFSCYGLGRRNPNIPPALLQDFSCSINHRIVTRR